MRMSLPYLKLDDLITFVCIGTYVVVCDIDTNQELASFEVGTEDISFPQYRVKTIRIGTHEILMVLVEQE